MSEDKAEELQPLGTSLDDEPVVAVATDPAAFKDEFISNMDDEPPFCGGKFGSDLRKTKHIMPLLAAFLGWGMDIYEGVIFTYAAPIAVPFLLGIEPGTAYATGQIALWTASFTTLLLVGWAIGGVLFGRLTDRFGRARVLTITVVLFAVATATCSLAFSIWWIAAFRFVAALAIGVEWSAGAALTLESMPAGKRTPAGILLSTGSPVGSLFGFLVAYLLTVVAAPLLGPMWSWRVVFVMGALPALVAVLVRWTVKEPAEWERSRHQRRLHNFLEIFAPGRRKRTLLATFLVFLPLCVTWCVSSFGPTIARYLANADAAESGGTVTSDERYNVLLPIYTISNNVGGAVSIVAMLWIAHKVPSRTTLLKYAYGYLMASMLLTYFTPSWILPSTVRCLMMLLVGSGISPLFTTFTLYLPELFSTSMRATGAGFAYNSSRVFTAPLPFVIGQLVALQWNPLILMGCVALMPAMGFIVCLLGVVEDTSELSLARTD